MKITMIVKATIILAINQIKINVKKNNLLVILCYIQVVFASLMCLGSILNLSIICALLWGFSCNHFYTKSKRTT